MALVAASAQATFHTFRIETLFSNADGSVQFIVLHETAGMPGERFLQGHALTFTRGPVVRSYAFPANLPSDDTAGRRVLVATQGFADLHLIAPDYIIPDRFLATDGGTLDYAGNDQVTYGALPTDGRFALSRTGATVANLAVNFAGASAIVPPLPVSVTEYYNPALDHYFISDLAPDIEALDTARIPGWMRTGQSFGVFAAPAPALNPVCRFYIPPEHGNSHFFSASPAECATVQARTTTDPNYSGYVYESPNAFFVALPDTTTGACAPQWIPVFRLWNQRADSNHRYTADPTVKAQMLAKSYVPEGYGPSATIMCAARRGMASVRFVQGSGEPNGALVSDGVSTAAAAYQGYATAGSSVIVGPRAGTGEVIAFSSRRAVTLQPAAWDTQAGDQTIDATLAGEIALPLTVWIVAGPYATAQQTALTLWSTAQQIFRDERLGITLPVEFVDATGHPKAASWTAFTCGGGNANVAALQSDIGARAGRINVYIVPLVDGSTSRGNACALGGQFAAIAAGATADLLAHEVGHDLALEHIDDLAAFNAANVMHSSSSTRMYLTEGQLFRAYLRSSSAMNALNLRPGQPVRDCDRDTLAIGCPAVHKRVWADGPLPPN